MSVAVNILASWGAHAITLIVGFFLMPFVLHTVGDVTYGTWLFINSIAGCSALFYAGLGESIIRFSSNAIAEKNWLRLNKISNCVILVYLGLGALAFLFLACVAALAPYICDWGNHSITEVRYALVILGANAFVTLAGCGFGGLLLGMQRFDLERGVIVAITILRLVLTLFFLTNEYSLVTLAAIFLTVSTIENLCFVVMAFWKIPTLRLHPKFLDRSVYKETFSFSIWVALATVADYLIYMVDAIVIGLILGPKALVPYSIAARLCHMVREPVKQVGLVCIPKAGELSVQNESSRQVNQLILYGMGIAFLLTTACFIGAGYFADLLITTWIGDGYLKAHLLICLLLFGQIFALPMNMLRDVLIGCGNIKQPAKMLFLEAILNLILSVSLIHVLGLYGVAIGTIVPIILVEMCVLLPFAFRMMDMPLSSVIRGVVAPQMIPLLSLFIYAITVDSLTLNPDWPTTLSVAFGGLATLGGSWLLCRKLGHRYSDFFNGLVWSASESHTVTQTARS